MAIRTVTVKIRIKTPEGKRVYANPVWETKGRLKPLWARVGTKAELHPEGVYCLRYGDKWEFCGQHIDVVTATKLRREQELEDAANNPAPITSINQSGPTILEAMEKYLAKKATMDFIIGKEALAPKTISGMRGQIEAFQRACGKTYMKEVTGQDLVAYFSMLRVQVNLNPAAPDYTEKLRKRNVTVKNHYATLRTFFKKHKINIADMLDEEQIPHCKGRTPEAYTRTKSSKFGRRLNPKRRSASNFSARAVSAS
jgi:hypothetical protein